MSKSTAVYTTTMIMVFFSLFLAIGVFDKKKNGENGKKVSFHVLSQ